MKRLRISIFIWLLVPIGLIAMEKDWHIYTYKDGFPGSTVYKVLQDKNAHLWFAMNTGLWRFDGAKFHYYSIQDGLPSNWIYDLAINPIDQSLWIATLGGLAHKTSRGFEVFLGENDPSQGFTCLAFGADGKLIIGSNKGAFELLQRRKKIKRLDGTLVDHGVKDMIHHEGEFYFGTGKGAFKYDGEDITPIEKTAGQNIRKFIYDRTGGVFYIEGLRNFRSLEDHRLIVTGGFIANVSFDLQNRLLVSSITDGPGPGVKIYQEGTLVDSLMNVPGNPRDPIFGMFHDLEGNMWMRKGDDLFRSKEVPIQLIQFPEAQTDFRYVGPYTNILRTADGKIWVSTEDMVSVFENDQLISPSLHAFENYGEITDMTLDANGHIWMSMRLGGVIKWDFKDFKRFEHDGGLYDRQISDILNVNDTLYAAGVGRLLKIVDDQVQSVPFDVLAGKYLATIATDKEDALWVGSSTSGLYKIENDKIVDSYLEKYQFRKVRIYGDQMWAIPGGLGLMSATINSKGKLVDIKFYNKENGFEFILLSDLIRDQKGHVWLTDFDRLYRFNPEDESLITLTSDDGFSQYTHANNGMQISDQNELLIACLEGIQKIDLNEFQPDTTGVNLSLLSVLQDNEVSFKKKFRAHQNDIGFEYSGILFSNQNRVSYRTRLLGLRKKWSNWSDETKIEYASLPPGEYVFQVQASNGQGEISDAEEYAFSIAVPLLQNKWFLLFLLFVGSGLVYAFYRSRLRKQQRESDRQNEIDRQLARLEIEALRSKMNPHFIFNSLNSIQHLILEKNEKGALDYLNKFGKLIRQVLEKSSDSKIKLLDEIEMLRNYIDLESLRFDAPFEYLIQISPSLAEENPEIPFLLIQPFVENAIHHGLIPKEKDGMLTILAQEENNKIKVLIEDNGVGREASKLHVSSSMKKQKSTGITSAKTRLKLIHQGLKEEYIKIIDLIDTETDKALGTRVEIEIPLA